MQDISFYINLGVQIIIGIVLVLIINHKNSQIETLKSNFSSIQEMIKLYNVDDFKKNVDLKLENQQLEHKRELEKVFENSKELVDKNIKDLATPWLIKYNELLNYEIHYLLQMEEEDLQKVFKLIPKNEPFIRQALNEIRGGYLNPEN